VIGCAETKEIKDTIETKETDEFFISTSVAGRVCVSVSDITFKGDDTDVEEKESPRWL
jgi:hypothetical protein